MGIRYLRYETVIKGLVVVGVVLRTREYFSDRSLWLDESLLALNIIHRSLTDLFRFLDYHQGAPLGFLLLEKIVIECCGSGEKALRLVPFVSGIISLLLFVKVARDFLVPQAVAIGVGLFAISDSLVYYSAEAKQYSSDVVVTVGLCLLASVLLKTVRPRREIIIGALSGAVALWFSQPAVFILAGLVLSLLCGPPETGYRRQVFRVSILVTAWAGSFCIYYLVSLRQLTHDHDLLDYWRNAFVPYPVYSLSAARWIVDSSLALFSDSIGLTLTGIGAVAAVLGAMQFFGEDRAKGIFLTVPVGVTLVAAGLHRYPFSGRLLLFLAPLLILLIAAGLASLAMNSNRVCYLSGALLVGFLFVHPIAVAAMHFVRPRTVEEIKLVIEYVTKHRLEGDVLYLYYSAVPPFDYYKERHLVAPMDQIKGVEARQNWKLYREDLDQLRGRKRVWILFSHVYHGAGVDEERLFLDYLDTIGSRLGSFQAPGASVYLYDTSRAQLPICNEPKTKRDLPRHIRGGWELESVSQAVRQWAY